MDTGSDKGCWVYEVIFQENCKRSESKGAVVAQRGDWEGLVPPNPKSRKKPSKTNDINLVRYTFRLKNYVRIGFFRVGAATEAHY